MYEAIISRIVRQCERNFSSLRGWQFGHVVSGDILIVTAVNCNGKHAIFAANLENPENVVIQHDGYLDLSEVTYKS